MRQPHEIRPHELREKYVPQNKQGPVTALCVSDVGFVAVGSEGGAISIIDLRGPSVIFKASMGELAQKEKRSSFLRGHSSATATRDYPVVIEFGIMTLDDDKYSSIACFVGTAQGKVATFKLLPAGNSYSAELAGVANLGLQDRVYFYRFTICINY